MDYYEQEQQRLKQLQSNALTKQIQKLLRENKEQVEQFDTITQEKKELITQLEIINLEKKELSDKLDTITKDNSLPEITDRESYIHFWSPPHGQLKLKNDEYFVLASSSNHSPMITNYGKVKIPNVRQHLTSTGALTTFYYDLDIKVTNDSIVQMILGTSTQIVCSNRNIEQLLYRNCPKVKEYACSFISFC